MYKFKNNLIKISGLINCNINSEICTLPENCRPKEQLVFVCMANNNVAIRVDVLANGGIYCYGSGNGWLSLDNITFIAGN